MKPAVLLLAVFTASVCAQNWEDRFRNFDKNGDGVVTKDEARGRKMFSKLDRNKDGKLTKAEARVFLDRSGNPPQVDAVESLDIPYRSEHKLQQLDVIAPKNAKAAPVMVYVHGGAWSKGDKSAVRAKKPFFVENGWVFISVNYRLLPEGKHPANVQDVAAALAWVHDHIADYGGDPGKIHLMGHSAGAHLASLAATDDRRLRQYGKDLSILRSVIELDTNVLDLPRHMATGSTFHIPIFGKDPAIWKDASPITHVAPGKAIPPFLLVHADNKVKKGMQAKGLAKALRKAGFRADVVDAPDRTHATLNIQLGEDGDWVTDRIMDFLASISEKTLQSRFDWKPSLLFRTETKQGPLPNNVMNLVVHKGSIYAGTATAFEAGNYSNHSAYIFAKHASAEPWQLEADFGQGAERIGAMISARFAYDVHGKPLKGGAVDLLLACTMQTKRRPAAPLQIHVRNDEKRTWQTRNITVEPVRSWNIREMIQHRDHVTSADLVFVAASPFGIIRGHYDTDKGLTWNEKAELVYTPRRGSAKWFGMATVNGILFASNNSGIYRRLDGPEPTWQRVIEIQPGRDLQNRELRGLTSVPSIGWPEPEMLLLSHAMGIWRMRCPKDPDAEHSLVQELDMTAELSRQQGKKVVFAEAAFNRLNPFTADGKEQWAIGVQLILHREGKIVSKNDPASYALRQPAYFFLRDATGRYDLQRIHDNRRTLFLARDFVPSPFPEEPESIYAGGFNGSYFKGSLGAAWIYRGCWKK